MSYSLSIDFQKNRFKEIRFFGKIGFLKLYIDFQKNRFKEIRFFGKIGFLNVKEIRFFGKIGFLTKPKYLSETL
jgi:hypothetical protein